MNLAKKTSFIFEGIRGSGKSTQIKKLKEKLEKDGFEVGLSDNSSLVYPISRDLRDYVKRERLFMSEAILHQLTNLIKVESILGNYDILLIDRFFLSNLVYTRAAFQLEEIDLDENLMRGMILNPFGSDYLDITNTIYLDCNVNMANGRISDRISRDKFDHELQRCARQFYLEELQRFRWNFCIVDGGRETTIVSKDILGYVEGML